MRLWIEGDRSRAICGRCKDVVATRSERRTVHLEGPRPVDVPHVLVAACVECGEVAAIPPRSSPRLRAARRESGRIEVRIPRVLDDAMGLVVAKDSARQEAPEAPIVRHDLRRIGKDRRVASRVRGLLSSPLATGPADARITIRVAPEALEAALAVARGEGLEGASDLIRGILVAAALDAGVIAGGPTRPSRRSRDAIAVIAEAVG